MSLSSKATAAAASPKRTASSWWVFRNLQAVRVHFCAHDNYQVILGTGYESVGHDQAVNKTGALVAHVHDGDTWKPQQSLRVTPRAREKMIGAECRKNNKVDISKIPSGVANRAADCLRCHRRSAFTLAANRRSRMPHRSIIQSLVTPRKRPNSSLVTTRSGR